MNLNKKYYSKIVFFLGAFIFFASTYLAHPATAATPTFVDTLGNGVGKSVVQTSDGGYAAAGYTSTYGAGGADFYITKFTSAGNLDSSFGTGGTVTVGGASDDEAFSIIQTSDGGYAITGFTDSFGAGGDDVYVVKLTSDGSLDTAFGTGGTLTIGGTGNDRGESIIQTSDGGYAIAGYTWSYGAGGTDAYIIKLTSAGALDTTFGTNGTFVVGNTGSDDAYSIIQTTDGGYAVAGDTWSYDTSSVDYYVIKLTSAGALDTTFGGGGAVTIGGSSPEGAFSIVQANDGGYAIAGYTQSFGAGYDDFYVTKLTSAGALDTTFGTNGTLTIGTSGGNESAYSMTKTSDGGYMIAGYMSIVNNDIYVAKITSAGALDATFGTGGILEISGSGSASAYAYSIAQTSDGGYVATGSMASLGELIIKMDSTGSMDGCSSYVVSGGATLGSGGTLYSVSEATTSGGTLGSGGAISSGGSLTQECSTVSSPTISSTAPTSSSITSTSATIIADITSTGGENPDRLIQYGTSSGTYTDTCDAGTGGTGYYSCALAGLSLGTKYYVRPEATNSAGTSYGTETSFTTNSETSGISLSDVSVDNNTATGTSVGTLSVTGSTSSYTYSLVDGTGSDDNSFFPLMGIN